MAKVLCCKENKAQYLCHTIVRYTDGLFFDACMNENHGNIKCRKNIKKRRERKSICRINERSCTVNGCSNRIQKGISECVYKIKKN